MTLTARPSAGLARPTSRRLPPLGALPLPLVAWRPPSPLPPLAALPVALDGAEAAEPAAAAGREPGAPADEPEPTPPLVIRKRGRRVTTEPPPGYTAEPALERQQSSENDARLRGDVPPHWG